MIPPSFVLNPTDNYIVMDNNKLLFNVTTDNYVINEYGNTIKAISYENISKMLTVKYYVGNGNYMVSSHKIVGW